MTRRVADEVNRPAEGLALWWLGNAGFAIRYREILMFVDPVIEVKSEGDNTISEIGLRLLHDLPLRAEEVGRTDIVMITHHHGDHAAPKTLEALKEISALFVCPESCLPVLDRVGVEGAKVRQVAYDQSIEYQEVSVEPTMALHGGRHGVAGSDLQMGAGYVVRAGGHSIFHPGDTVLLEQHYELRDIEILLLPICQHSRTLIDLPEILAPRFVVAMHYDTYEITENNRSWTYGDPEEIRQRLRSPERLVVLEQGEVFKPP